MLRWSYKNKQLYKVYKKSGYELKINLSKIIIYWFLSQHKLSVDGKINFFNKLLIDFLKNFVNGLIVLKVRWIKRLINYKILEYETRIFMKWIQYFNKILMIDNSLILLRFYRRFFKFYWSIDKTIVKYYFITKKFLNSYIMRLNNSRLLYLYGYLSKLNKEKISYTKIKTACFVTGRSRAVLRAFKLSRFKMREFTKLGLFIGLNKSSW